MYRSIFNKVRAIVPKISDTELIALRTGDTHLDRHIFEGNYRIPKKLDKYETKFDEAPRLLRNSDRNRSELNKPCK